MADQWGDDLPEDPEDTFSTTCILCDCGGCKQCIPLHSLAAVEELAGVTAVRLRCSCSTIGNATPQIPGL